MPLLAHQPIHPDGGFHQDDLECRRGHRRSLVAPERFWHSRFALQYPRGEVTV